MSLGFGGVASNVVLYRNAPNTTPLLLRGNLRHDTNSGSCAEVGRSGWIGGILTGPTPVQGNLSPPVRLYRFHDKHTPLLQTPLLI